MSRPGKGADAARVTTTATRDDEQQDVRGRFARTVPPEAHGLDSVAETRTVQVDQMRNRMKRAGYRVDSHAVAEAIIARLKAGGTVTDGVRSPSRSPRPPAR
jgi:hypothetical protein